MSAWLSWHEASEPELRATRALLDKGGLSAGQTAQLEAKAASLEAARPEQDRLMSLCLRAWFDLSSCRGIGMATGPIPWTAMLAWVDRKRLPYEVGEIVIAVLQYLDGERAEKIEAKRRMDAMKA